MDGKKDENRDFKKDAAVRSHMEPEEFEKAYDNLVS